MLRVDCKGQLPDTVALPVNYDYNYIENDGALLHVNQCLLSFRDSVTRPFRILHIGDSHVKSGFFAETFADLLDSVIRSTTSKLSLQYPDSTAVLLKVMAKNGAMAKTILQSVYNDTVVQQFNPDLVIISLGTNEGYNRLSLDSLSLYQESLIEQVFRDAPSCDILLTTPGDGLKRHYSKVRISKKRRRYRTVVTYSNNDYLPEVINYYINIPERIDVAVWNFYAVMGGEESIREWHKEGFAQRDMIHLTRQGYQLQARLLLNAFIQELDDNQNREE